MYVNSALGARPQTLSTLLSALLPALTLCIVSALGGVGCDSDDDFQATASGLLSFTPETLTFPVIPIGQEVTQDLTLNNVGSAPISVINVRLSRTESPYTVSRAGGEPIDETIVIEPQSEVLEVIRVTYTPTEDQTFMEGDALILETNNAQQRQITIPIQTSSATPDLVVNPSVFDFGSVDAGEVKEIEGTLLNVGQGSLVISELRIDGSDDFSFSLTSVDGDDATDAPSYPIVIEPGEQRAITVRYEPPLAGADRADLVVVSNNASAETSRYSLIANGAAPCIQVTPDALDFGAALMVPSRDEMTPNISPVIIESCGGAPLTVSRIEFEGPAFGLTTQLEADDEGDLIRLPAASPGEVFPSQIIEVGFWPTAEQNYGGRMLLYTNTSAEPIAVDLFGRGVENSCPLPVTTLERYEVAPLEIITLDGSPSADPGGEVQRWVWSVVERPSGSVSRVVESLFSNADPAGGGPEDDEATPTATFFVDLAGRYVIELEVYDNLGQVSCAPNAVATVIIEAIPTKDLHIQLVWSTFDDPDETDEFGTDVDLHFKHENAGDRWGNAADGWDCYFQNTSPDWGNIGDFLDNPSLDIDDINGAGPENVNLNNPEVGVSYDVGALYFRSESVFGESGRDPRIEHESYVTVRLFARGELLGEFERVMSRLNQLWHVATIDWCEDLLMCPVITPVDRLYEEGEYAQ